MLIVSRPSLLSPAMTVCATLIGACALVLEAYWLQKKAAAFSSSSSWESLTEDVGRGTQLGWDGGSTGATTTGEGVEVGGGEERFEAEGGEEVAAPANVQLAAAWRFFFFLSGAFAKSLWSC